MRAPEKHKFTETRVWELALILEKYLRMENLLGEAVNFAVRLESFAQPNGISLSKRFYQNLGMSELLVSDHGIQTIKNSQIHCFDLILPGLRKRRLLSSVKRDLE